MRTANMVTLVLTVLFLSVALADDNDKDKTKNEKKPKLPPLTFVYNVDGEITEVDADNDRITVQYKDIKLQWVANQGGGSGLVRRMNQGTGNYVPKEEKKDISIMLSPELKVRLMYPQNGSADANSKKKQKQPTAKELAAKDPDYQLGGAPGKKSDLAKGQIVRVSMGRNNDRINPQIYGMAVFVVTEGR